MKKSALSFIAAIVFIIFSLIAVCGAQASMLDLLGIGWGQSEVTVAIKASRGVTPQATSDVERAVYDWNAALQGMQGGPKLVLLYGARSADITIHLKVGGGSVLGQALSKTMSPFSCSVKTVSIQLSGKAFGHSFSNAGTQNVARHELGHALGLGHSDDPTDLMYAAADASDIFGNSVTPISACDLRGMEAVYPLPAYCEIPPHVSCE